MEVGDIVAGKYRVRSIVGRGGMGMVVAADHLLLQQSVALKCLLPSAASDPEVLERFVREARASAQLRGEHVCRVVDVGAEHDGAPYLVMELLEGRDLATVLAAHGHLPLPAAVDYVLQACVGLAEAHALGLVHRDLKPANLFLAERPDGTAIVKLLDFGIAKHTAAGQLTRTHAVLGSPAYMSPEQLRASRAVDARSDIWALGAILHELVTGRRAFDAPTLVEIVVRVTVEPPPLLDVSVPPGFQELVLRCLERDPDRRFPHVGALAAALAPFGRPGSHVHAEQVDRLLAARRASEAGPPAAPSLASTVLGAPTVSGEPAAPVTTFGSAASSFAVAPATPATARRRGAKLGGALTVAALVTAIAVQRDAGSVRSAGSAAPPDATTAPAPATAAAPEPSDHRGASAALASPPAPTSAERASAAHAPASPPAPARAEPPRSPAHASSRDHAPRQAPRRAGVVERSATERSATERSATERREIERRAAKRRLGPPPKPPRPAPPPRRRRVSPPREEDLGASRF